MVPSPLIPPALSFWALQERPERRRRPQNHGRRQDNTLEGLSPEGEGGERISSDLASQHWYSRRCGVR